MNIAWNAIGSVAAVSLGTIVVVSVLFGIGALGVSRYERARAQGNGGTLSAVGVGVAFLACVAIALFGLYLTVVR
jgi:multisubunit Na+/H+ antiporter MnhG subunit